MNVNVVAPLRLNIGILLASQTYNFTDTYYRELKKVLRIRRAENISLVRVGRNHDGGYIMADDFKSGGGIAYSFGISNEVSWDLNMAERGYEIFQYDMTIDKLPLENEHFHFSRQGIAGEKIPDKYLDTLENFIKFNGHEHQRNMILKMDVEGAEWDFLRTLPKNLLNKFDQLVFEFHNLIQPKNFFEMSYTVELLKKLNKTHTLVHLHGNNNSPYLQIEDIGCISDTLEATYLLTEKYSFVDDENIFLPKDFDDVNNLGLQEIPLGYWNKFTI